MDSSRVRAFKYILYIFLVYTRGGILPPLEPPLTHFNSQIKDSREKEHDKHSRLTEAEKEPSPILNFSPDKA